jgi:signal transduction histidine kinase
VGGSKKGEIMLLPKRRAIRTRHIVASLVALALIGAIVATSVFSTRRNLSDFSRMVERRDIVLELDRLTEAMLDCETGTRGFVLTGDETYLLSFKRGADVSVSIFERLNANFAKDTENRERLETVRYLAQAALNEMRHAIDLRKNAGPEPARQLLATNVGKDLMDRLRAKIDALRSDRIDAMTVAQGQAVKNLKRTNWAITICAAVALTGACVFMWMLYLHLKNLEAQHELRGQREAARRADRVKSEFLAVMSHEIRTPMNSILGFGELLHDSAENPRDRKFAAAILTSGNALLTLINDLLDISRIEAGKLEIHAEPVDVRDLAQQLELLFIHRAQEKHIRYEVGMDSSVPPWLSFDPLRVRQILLNLVGNAMKFTREGSVQLKIGPFQTQSRGEGGVLRFSVTDTGIGIPKDKLNDIFRPFFQVDSQAGRQFQGSGLGLAISRQLVAMMGGALTVESQPGSGSVFRVALPVQFAKPSPAPATGASPRVKRDRPPPPPTTPLDWDIPARPVAEWRQLLETLQGSLAEEAERLATVVPAKAALDFTQRLGALADPGGWPLGAYAAALAAQVESFETESASARLRAFPELASSLSKALDQIIVSPAA